MTSTQIKVVLDTNVLISSLWGRKPRKVIEMWDKGGILVIVSQQVLDEYFDVLNRFELTEEDIEDITILFSNPRKTLVIKPKSRINRIKKDPADNRFLECAIEGDADFIISGDKHLLELGNFENSKIVTPGEFLDKVKYPKK